MVHLGIRSLISKIRHQTPGISTHSGTDQNYPLAPKIHRNLMTDIELSRLGPKILNNVGVIARKS